MLNFHPPKLNVADQFKVSWSKKSWWQVRYESGKVISEWDTAFDPNYKVKKSFFTPKIGVSLSRWEEIPKQGIRGLYLICPNGKCSALEGDGSNTFFQLKVGFSDIGAGLDSKGSLKEPKQVCRAHIIGKVDSENGHCVCFAYEYEETTFSQWECKKCGGFGSKKLMCPRCLIPVTRMNPVRFEDTVTNMAYEQIGAISLGHHTGVI